MDRKTLKHWSSLLFAAHRKLGLGTQLMPVPELMSLVCEHMSADLPPTRVERMALLEDFCEIAPEPTADAKRHAATFRDAFRKRDEAKRAKRAIGRAQRQAGKGTATAKTVRPAWKRPEPPDPRSDAFLQSYEWRQLRMLVLKERGARCECCGSSPKDGQTVLNVDHIKPRKYFPELALEKSNLQVLCHVCNHGKGNWDQTDWRAELGMVQ